MGKEKKVIKTSEQKDFENTYYCYKCDYSWTIPKSERIKGITKVFCPHCGNTMVKEDRK